MKKVKELLKYPIMVLFFAFLAVFTLVDVLKPAQERSELENKPLQQAPEFSWATLTAEEEERSWTYKYGEFTRDQFLFRDQWVSIASALDAGQGKLEIGGVWLAKDGYQLPKNVGWSPAQEKQLALNTDALIELTKQNPGKVKAMIVPSPANVLSYKLKWSPPQVDEEAKLDETFSALSTAGVGVIDLRDAFYQNEAEGRQTYYRTDHHWTTGGGALLAYQTYCQALGFEGALPSPELRVDVPDFYGTSFAKTKLPGTRPDDLQYYDLPNLMTVQRVNAETDEIYTTTGGIMDKDKLSTYDKYAAFLQGNNGYSEIEGNGELSVLVIKDSYANSFVPYLVENFGKIGVVDPRSLVGGVSDIMAEKDFQHILVLYSFDAFSTDGYAYRMAR